MLSQISMAGLTVPRNFSRDIPQKRLVGAISCHEFRSFLDFSIKFFTFFTSFLCSLTLHGVTPAPHAAALFARHSHFSCQFVSARWLENSKIGTS
jgi:hypothetical protein